MKLPDTTAALSIWRAEHRQAVQPRASVGDHPNGSLTAAEALAIGLVGRVVPDAELDAAGFAEAQRLASGPAEVMGLAKILMARSFESSLDEMFAYEGLGQALAMSNPEFREGLAAMLDRRPADFPAAAAAARR